MTEDRTKKERQAKYKESRARLDLMLLPEVLERFKNLQGLEGKAHPERLVALMDCWDNRHSQQQLVQDEDTPEDTINKYRQRLAKYTATWAKIFKDEPLSPENALKRDKLKKKWAKVIKTDPTVKTALRAIKSHAYQMAEWIADGRFAYVTPNDLTALISLPEADQLSLLLYLMANGGFTQVDKSLPIEGLQFQAALKRQPARSAGWNLITPKANIENLVSGLKSVGPDSLVPKIQDNSFQLRRRLWPGRQKAPAAWTEAMKAADAQAALARVKALSGPLCKLIEAGCLSISADEVIALGKLSDEDFPVMVAQLSENGKFKGHGESDAEIHFEMLLSGVSV